MLAGYDVPNGLNCNSKEDENTLYEHKAYCLPKLDQLLLEHILCLNMGWCTKNQTCKQIKKKSMRKTKKNSD